jgi:hypothetical protein
MDDKAKNRAYKILSWIFNSKRPLIIDELREALAVEPGNEQYEADYFRESEFIVETCKNLVAHTDMVRF